jgi:excisionase family DNA binding protein
MPIIELFSADEAAAYLRLKPQTLAIWRSTNRYGIPYRKCGRLVRYDRADLDRWLASRTRTHVGQQVAE